MKFTVTRASLIKPLQMIGGVVEKRQTLPILSNVLLTVTNETLSLTATDLEIELIGVVPLTDVEECGTTTVSAKKIFDICRALPEEAVLKIKSEGEQVVIRSGSSRFALTTLPAQDYPNIENGPFPHEFSMDGSKLKKLINKTHFAMGQQDVRHYLNGALFDINHGVMKCVATDGHRLAHSTINEENTQNISVKVILPRKSILELIRLLDTNESGIHIAIGEAHFRVTTAHFTFTSKLINAQYPDYEKLIPRTVENTATASREALKQALVRASILSNEKFRGIRVMLESGELRIIANNPEQEEAEEKIALDYSGHELEIGFNAAYLLDVVSSIASEQIKCSFNDPNSGVLIEPSDNADALYVVMPMRL